MLTGLGFADRLRRSLPCNIPATSTRQALEEGNPQEVTRIVEEGDTGVLQQVLKATCVEAAAEIGGLKDPGTNYDYFYYYYY